MARQADEDVARAQRLSLAETRGDVAITRGAIPHAEALTKNGCEHIVGPRELTEKYPAILVCGRAADYWCAKEDSRLCGLHQHTRLGWTVRNEKGEDVPCCEVKA